MVAPVAYQVILEPGVSQFREFESPRVHTRINSWGLFLVHKLTYLRKPRERELAQLDENRRAVGLLNPMRDKNRRQEHGGRRDDICTTACPEAGKYMCVKKKENYGLFQVPTKTPHGSSRNRWNRRTFKFCSALSSRA